MTIAAETVAAETVLPRTVTVALTGVAVATTSCTPPARPANNVAANKQIAAAQLAARGWAGQMSCLDNLWTHESSWNVYATNPSSGAYGSLFYTILSFHAAHVFVGLVVIAVVLLRAALGHFTRERHLAVTNAAWYWHFVDVVWLFVLTSLYFTPRFS